MKRKLLTVLLTLITAFCLCFAVSACDSGNSSNSGSGTEQSNPQKPDEGEEQKPDKGEEQTPDEGVEQKPDEGGEQKPEHVHSFIDYVYNNDATCTEDGTETAACTCGVTDTRLKEDTALGHDYQQFEAKPATCADAGYEAYEVCQRCNDSTFKGYIPALHVNYRLNNEAYTVSGLFSDCTDGEIVIPETYMGKPVTSIGDEAFFRCSRLTGVLKIPVSVTSIGDMAFAFCSGLTSITIPASVTSIGESAFAFCSGLTSITIPDSVTSIGRYTFQDCSGLTSVTISDSVTSIRDYAFLDCSRLTSIVIPDSVTSIEENAFVGCNGLIQKEGNVHYVDQWAIGCDSSATEIALRKGTKGIANFAFSFCELESVTIGGGVTSIGDFAFSGCRGITNITIPKSVISIGSGAFMCCSSLTSIVIPESVIYIGQDAFSDCPLERVTVQGNSNWQVSKTSDFANAETVNVTDPAKYVDYFTFDYIEYFWKRS